MRRMDRTEAVILCKDVSSFKWIAEGNPCGEGFSLLIFGNFLKCIFLRKAQTRSIISFKSVINSD